MADVRRIYAVCDQCAGKGHLAKTTQAVGQDPVVTQEPCPKCKELKYYLFGWVLDTVFDSDDELENL